MAGLIVGLVLRIPCTREFNTAAKMVAVVYADHAWQDGTHAHPAIHTVALESGLHERTAQRYIRFLERFMLVPDGKGPRGTNQYRFDLEERDGLVGLRLRGGGAVGGWRTARGGADSGGVDSGGVPPPESINRHIVVVDGALQKISTCYEKEFGALTPMIADMIQDDAKTYPVEWISEAMEIAVGAGHRNWRYVRGILKKSAEQKKSPRLTRVEGKNGKTKVFAPKSQLTESELQAAREAAVVELIGG